eukprot:Nk52_evm30s265 gene=Nk52_evmTU30s265
MVRIFEPLSANVKWESIFSNPVRHFGSVVNAEPFVVSNPRHVQLAFSPGCEVVNESPTLAINIKAKQMREVQGREIAHFGFGQSPFPVPDVFIKGLVDHATNNHYLPTFGLPALRKAVATYFRDIFKYEHANERSIVVGPGSKELLFDILFMLDAEVLVPSGSWVSYGPQAKMLNKSLRILETDFAHGFCLEANVLERACLNSSSALKILVLNSPNNPTGQIYSEESLQLIANVCREHNVLVVSDEIYALIDFTDKPYASLARYYPEGTIVTGGVSKLFSGGGYRLGFAVVPDEMDSLLAVWKGVISETYSCVSSPVQFAALAIYENLPMLKSYIEDTVAIHKLASLYLYKRFVAMGLDCKEPLGGFYLMPIFNSYKREFEEYCQRNNIAFTEEDAQSSVICNIILEQAGVVMLPGCDFYVKKGLLAARVASVDYDGEAVLKYVQNGGQASEENIEELMPRLVHGCNRLESFLKSLKRQEGINGINEDK